ncbi:hypothetical protein [Candidatus Marithrix sp. Canyon 246]|uniref:hypothetical protein n=1 Tax=Candidatus Marithrix sp. Canyon 246 TaxID=1827136 RepID=UPI000849F737|nr:hypothetical protein [Candidatus Marithrix sp. Canyon 246]
MNFEFEVALIKTIWGEPYEVKVSRAVLKTSSLWRHRGLSLTDWHEFARTGKWQDPRENLMYACIVIDNARKFFKREGLRLNDDQLLHAVIAAYNGGATATKNAIKAGKDIDANTTGKDYGRDVLNRTAWFQLHGWK